MRKFLLTAFVCLIFPGYLLSQDNVAAKQKHPFQINTIDTPLLVIKGEEFKRFPSGNFLDAVNGLFPWVFSQTPNANSFLFVVDGYLLSDINGISLYDIEEVSFTRNTLESSLYPFSRAGTFYITTKRTVDGKPVIQVNSQYNTIWNNEATVFPPNASVANDPSYVNHTMNKTGHYSSHQASLTLDNKKFHLYTSAQFDETRTPHLYQQFTYDVPGNSTTAEGNSFTRQNDLKAFLNFEYHFNSKFSAGITGNYFHGNSKLDSAETSVTLFGTNSFTGIGSSHSQIPLTYYHLGSFINWQPLRNFHNRVSFEYADDRYTYESTSLSKSLQNDVPVSNSEFLRRDHPVDKRYVLRDQAGYDFIPNGKFRLGAVINFSYLYDKVTEESFYNSSNVAFGGNYFYTKQKFTTLSPMVTFAFDNIVSGYAGNAFILNKGVSRFTNHPNSNPYAGLNLDIKNLAKLRKCPDKLEISFNYAEMTQNTSNTNWLPAFNQADQFNYIGAIYGTGAIFFPVANPVILKNKLTSLQLIGGFMHNRIIAGASWSTLDLDTYFMIPIAIPPNGIGYFATVGKVTQTGTSLFVKGKLIDKPHKVWDMGFNVLFPHSKYSLYNDAPPPVDVPVNYSAQFGWQNKFQLRGFYAQVNALFGLNRKSSDYPYGGYSPPVNRKFNEFLLNYIVFGYDIANIKNPALKGVSLFVHARNLLSSKEAKHFYQNDSYAGAGVNVTIN